MLEIDKICVSYGRVPALTDVSLIVEEGECVALLGSNGAGKSTTLQTISGLLTPTSGSIRFGGKVISGLPAHQLVREGVIQVPEGRKIFPDLLVRENLQIGAYSRRDSTADDLDLVLDLFPVLKERLSQKGGTLSGGEQQMLAVGRALMGRPRLLMLDEPSLGLAPMVVDLIFQAFGRLKKQMTILLVEQNIHIALELVDRGYVLSEGRVARHGTALDLGSDDWIREAYFGSPTH